MATSSGRPGRREEEEAEERGDEPAEELAEPPGDDESGMLSLLLRMLSLMRSYELGLVGMISLPGEKWWPWLCASKRKGLLSLWGMGQGWEGEGLLAAEKPWLALCARWCLLLLLPGWVCSDAQGS